MEKLFEIQKIIIEQFEQRPYYARKLFAQIVTDAPITGITGARGIGKTTFLLKCVIEAGAKQRKALYVSADNIFFLENNLLELVDWLYKETNVRLLCIDEVHKYSGWNQALKNISDTYLDFKIIFSGSSTIDIVHSQFDLSRRVILHNLHGLSFREYLEFYLGINVPLFKLDDLIKDHLKISQELSIHKILNYFREYLKVGYYPFFKEFTQDRDKFQAIENATQKTIYEDIATLHSLKTPTLQLMEKLFKFVINSSPGEISVYKISSSLGKDFDSISEYLRLLEQAGLIRFLFSKKSGHAYLRNPVKIYPENTNLIHASYLPITKDTVAGKIRETFALTQLQNAGCQVFYSGIGDFCVNDFLFEIGGRNKTTYQIKGQDNAFVLSDGILTGSEKIIPLHLLGLLY